MLCWISMTPITSSRDDRHVTHMTSMDCAAMIQALSQELGSFVRQRMSVCVHNQFNDICNSTQARASSISERILNAPSSDPDDLNNSFEFFNSATPYAESKCPAFTLPRTRIRNVMENRNHKFRPADISQNLGKFSEKNSTSDTTCREMVPLVPSSTTHSSMPSECPVKKDCKTSEKDEVEKLAYQLNEEAKRTERPIRRLSKVMYGSTCADMQVDVMGECLSSIKHVVGVRSVFLAKRLHAV
ncbi:uncharacterized protein TNCV_4072101 [Trichonephila clavipes]|uniref:Uncharacterized protein n=1 Tax=Trichonephila clavipes TaxID=2585209 RepID=A0A8X7BGV6_TRICX|nr:uncharacterized protein TNCV_4072101 [Trichonephila clavipes]